MKFARTYIGEAVYVDGLLNYLMHEEGRVAYEIDTENAMEGAER